MSSNIYQNLEFNFNIHYIRPKINVAENHSGRHGHWEPPTNPSDFEKGSSTGWFLRTQDSVTRVNNHIGRKFRSCSLLYDSQKDYYLGVPFDCLTDDLSNFQRKNGMAWRRVRFNNDRDDGISLMNFEGTEHSLPSPGSKSWIPQLVPKTYDYNDPHPIHAPSRQLAGDLAILIAFIAFSCPEFGNTEQVRWVVDNCFKPPRWHPHNFSTTPPSPSGINRCGVIVEIRLNPTRDEQTSTFHLNKFQNGDYGPLVS